jgi:glycosyltransferase involved in cell wall biosynthesis
VTAPQPSARRAAAENAPDVSVIIPCLNEEQNVPSVVERVRELLASAGVSAEVLIVDDCSDDYTFREAYLLAQRWDDVKALHKGLPRGIGHAIRHAIDHATGQMGVVVMGDGVDPLAAIPDMRDAILRDGHDLVLLSRYLDPGDSASIPLTYRVYQAAYRRLLSFACALPYRDATYAFRGFRMDFVRGLGLTSGGFEISPEMTLKTWTRGGSITELKGRQGRRMAGESKFLFSEQAFGYARVALEAYRDARRRGNHQTANWAALLGRRGA